MRKLKKTDKEIIRKYSKLPTIYKYRYKKLMKEIQELSGINKELKNEDEKEDNPQTD